MPFDRNEAGQWILENKVFGGTLAKGCQVAFVEELLASLKNTAGHSDLVRVRMQADGFRDGM